MSFYRPCLLCLIVALPLSAGGQEAGLEKPFEQQTHQAFPLQGDKENEVRAVAVDTTDGIWAATGAGVFKLDKNEKRWDPLLPKAASGPAYTVYQANDGGMWAGAWNGAYKWNGNLLEAVEGTEGPISAIAETASELWLLGPKGIWRGNGVRFERHESAIARSVRGAVAGPGDALWVCTGQGLFDLMAKRVYRGEREILSSSVFDASVAPDNRLWVGGLGGITVYDNGNRVSEFTPANGLPTIYVQAIEVDAQGRIWAGTTHGVSFYDGNRWSLRHGRRWLVHDDVRDVAFDREGTAWLATAGGVSAIRSEAMSFERKEKYFQELAETRHTREPGFTEKVELEIPGDYESWKPEDDDNDGEYTAMYLVAQSYRYAVTKSEAAKAQARRAFHALKFLQTVTGTDGFVARTAIPPHWEEMHDPNLTYTEQERADRLVQDPRFKPVEQRWHTSKDGKWLWKGDTSSDEITGHFYGYGYYYDLVADDREKEVVREHTKRVMDYIVNHGYVLMDIDGQHTRWGVWAPERLRGDPDWAAEAGINATEILSYLKTTYHMTGEEKYQREYLRLLNDEGYRELVPQAKTFAPAWRTHIDDELLALTWPGLLKYETDPELRTLYLESMKRWYEALIDNKSPFFNFIYAELTSQPDARLDESLEFLRDAPLDLINWTVDNSQREDVKLVRNPNIEPMQTEEVMPPSERGVVRWDKNPFEAVQGDGGRTAWAPTFWLLPYWQARYLGVR